MQTQWIRDCKKKLCAYIIESDLRGRGALFRSQISISIKRDNILLEKEMVDLLQVGTGETYAIS
ncbi:hypothetical protein C2845_PM08G05730 [Panicum miliaceum]|uniref:Uncharacterized protein n=1 Tax=Panicum miliaceum TaxID=4540 RepID=A0A3L6QXF4_PANMI|nr:hypothetical protein C2845_PM08G05730 [Panicum miliaceum]